MTERISPPTLAEMEDSLAHFGVKGMRWGVRRDDSGSGSGGSSKKKPLPTADLDKMNRELDAHVKKYAASGSFGPKDSKAYLDKREAIIRKHVKNKEQADSLVENAVRRPTKEAVKAVAKKAAPTTDQMEAAAKAAKVASKKAVDYGVLPLAATAAGLAFPAAVVIGMATKALYDPHVQAAIKAGAQYSAGLVSQIGTTTLSTMRGSP